MTVASGAKLLMQKYGLAERRNPWGYTILSLGTAIYIVNWTLFLIHSFNGNLIPFEWGYASFWRVTFAVYIGFSFCLESIYFRWGYKLIFQKNGAVNSIDIFCEAFGRLFFHGIFVVLQSIACAVMLIFGEDGNVSFYRFGIPLLLQIWLIATFFCSKYNRPSPCTWFELNVWRPIVECAWHVAIKNYISRNPNETPPNLVWIEISNKHTAESDGKVNGNNSGNDVEVQSTSS